MKHISIFTLFIALLIGIIVPQSALAMYKVENVRVDVTAANALKARDKAFEQAQVKAFQKLGDQLIKDGTLTSFKMPSTSKVSGFIQDFEITDEKLSNVRYIGTYTFRFSESAVMRHYAPRPKPTESVNDPYATTNIPGATNAYNPAPIKRAPNMDRILLLPFYKTAAGTQIWNTDNPWRNTLTQDSLTQPRLIVPNGSNEDIQAIKNDESFQYNQYDLSRMLGRYNADRAVIAVAQPAPNGLAVDLYNTDTARPAFIKRLNVSAPAVGQTAPTNQNLILTTASQTLRQTLLREYNPAPLSTSLADNASTRYGSAVPPSNSRLRVEIPVKSLREWSSTQSALQKIPSIRTVQIKALSPSRAVVHLTHFGNEQALRRDLERANMTLTSVDENTHSLYMNRYAPNYVQQF